MAAYSGQYGKVTVSASNLVECSGWDMTLSAPGKAYASCETSQSKQRVPGVKDATGTLNGFFDPSSSIFTQLREGSTYTALLYYDTDKWHSVPLYIESIEMSVDINDGDIITWSARWSLDGTLALDQS